MSKTQSPQSIIEDLAKGSISIDTVEDYKKLLTTYPDNPLVNRLFADFLKKERSFANAIKRYRKAYDLFIGEGETLQAIAALFELWEIVKPFPYDFRSLHSHLRHKKAHNSFIDECFATMSYKELRATLSHLKKIRVQADEIVLRPGDPEETLYFVISGRLVKSPTRTTSDQHAVDQFLSPNDHFGDNYPFESRSPAPYLVKAASAAELLKIAKEDFLSLCAEYPNLKSGIKKLINYQQTPDAEKPEKFFRKTSRSHLTISLTLDILAPEPGRQPLILKGFSSDISLGGACVFVDPNYRDIRVKDMLHRKTRLRVSLPDESITVSIMGRIAWFKETKVNGKQTCALGVQFNDTPPRLRASMIVFVTAVASMSKHAANYNLSQDEIEAQ